MTISNQNSGFPNPGQPQSNKKTNYSSLARKFIASFVVSCTIIVSSQMATNASLKIDSFLFSHNDDIFFGDTQDKTDILMKTINICGNGNINICINGAHHDNLNTFAKSLIEELIAHNDAGRHFAISISDKNEASISEKKYRSMAFRILFESENCSTSISSYITSDIARTINSSGGNSYTEIPLSKYLPSKISMDCESIWSLFFNFATKKASKAGEYVSIKYLDAKDSIDALYNIFSNARKIIVLPDSVVNYHNMMTAVRSDIDYFSKINICGTNHLCIQKLDDAQQKLSSIINSSISVHSHNTPQNIYINAAKTESVEVIKIILLILIALFFSAVGGFFIEDILKFLSDN
jgi:hypothetical protein